MMKVISVINKKGGCGKSTIAVNLAIAYAIKGKEVLIIDTDEQATAATFRDVRLRHHDALPQFAAVKVTSPTLHKDIKTFSADIIIIDGAKNDTDLQRNTMGVSDMVIIPLQPSAPDMWATEKTFKNTIELRTNKPQVKIFALLNQCQQGTKLMEETLSIRKDIKRDYEIPFLGSILYRRESYKRTFADGRGILEGDDTRAKKEFMKFFDEINRELR